MESERSLRGETSRFYPNGEFSVLPGVDHLASLKAPEELAKTIAALITPS